MQPKPFEHSVTIALTAFIKRYTTAHPHLTAPYDPLWRSVCESGVNDAGELTCWQPVRRDDPDDFTDLELALKLNIHPDIKAFYSSFWSGTLVANAKEGAVSLLLLWNEEDLQHLLTNFIGHVLQQRRQRLPITWFFACTDDHEYYLSVDNNSGAVLLEAPGLQPLRQVADNLASFLSQLTPAASLVEKNALPNDDLKLYTDADSATDGLP